MRNEMCELVREWPDVQFVAAHIEEPYLIDELWSHPGPDDLSEEMRTVLDMIITVEKEGREVSVENIERELEGWSGSAGLRAVSRYLELRRSEEEATTGAAGEGGNLLYLPSPNKRVASRPPRVEVHEPQEPPRPLRVLDPPDDAPVLLEAARYGLAGELLATLEPHTEADPAGLLFSFLPAFGNMVGDGPHAVADGATHPGRLNAVLVGETSRSRKGTAWANVKGVLAEADPAWVAGIASGLSTGEGLIAALSDEADADRRLMVVEPEFARTLKVAARDNNTLSPVVRQAYDGGTLRVMTRKDPLIATGAHVSVVGHVTRDELLRHMSETEVANGLANRFLFALVHRRQLLPEGGHPNTEHLSAEIGTILREVSDIRLMRRSKEATELWREYYAGFAQGSIGLLDAVTARPEAHVLRLSVIYALLDASPVVEVVHLQAAHAVWTYAEESARAIFGDALGDPVADRLLAALKEAHPDGLDLTAQHALFKRNISAQRLELARNLLGRAGLIETVEEPRSGGRPRVVSRYLARNKRI